MFFFHKKKNNEAIDNSRFKVVDRLDLKPYLDLKYDLIYAHNEILLENDDVTIACRKYRNALLKFVLVNHFDKVNDYSIDNESLKKMADKKGYFEYINKEDLDTHREVQIYIFKECSEDIKKYCFISAKATSDLYRQLFIYDHDQGQLMLYRQLRDYGPLQEQYRTALFFDLACVDKEVY